MDQIKRLKVKILVPGAEATMIVQRCVGEDDCQYEEKYGRNNEVMVTEDCVDEQEAGFEQADSAEQEEKVAHGAVNFK